MSDDNTREILESYGSDITVLDDYEVGYHQSRKMTKLAHMAGERGATHIIPFDADEVWEFHFDIRNWDEGIFVMKQYIHVPQSSGSDHPNPLIRIEHRESSAHVRDKVAFRYHRNVKIQMGNHSVIGINDVKYQSGNVRHYKWRSLDHVRRKARQGVAALESENIGSGYCAHWRSLDKYKEKELEAWWAKYTDSASQHLVYDPYQIG